MVSSRSWSLLIRWFNIFPIQPFPEDYRGRLLALPYMSSLILHLLEGEPIWGVVRLASQHKYVDSPVLHPADHVLGILFSAFQGFFQGTVPCCNNSMILLLMTLYTLLMVLLLSSGILAGQPGKKENGHVSVMET